MVLFAHFLMFIYVNFALCMVSIQERVIVARVRYIKWHNWTERQFHGSIVQPIHSKSIKFGLDWLSCFASNLKQLPQFWMFWFFWIGIFHLKWNLLRSLHLFVLLVFLNTAGVTKQHQKNSSKPTFTKWLAAELSS